MAAKKKKNKKNRGWLANRAAGGSPVAVSVVPGRVTPASDKTFRGLVLDSPEPVLVDFWAEWCVPCKRVAPVVEDLAREFSGRVRMVKLDVDKNPKVAAKYSIRSIPTLMVFKAGEAVSTMVGVQSKRDLTKAVKRALD